MGTTYVDVLWENEVNANKVMVWTALATSVVYTVAWILTTFEFIYIDKLHKPHLMYVFIILIMCISSAASLYYKCQKRWIKYLMMISFILTFMVVDTLYTEYIPFLMVIPMVLASRYFSRKYTFIMIVITDIAFLISTILGVYYGTVPVSCLELPAGTIIDMGGYTWFSDVVDEGFIAYDKNLMLKNVLLYSYLPEFFISRIVAVSSVIISDQGLKIISRQRELTEHSARIQTELSLAANIQMDMLPSEYPAFPDRNEIDIYGSSTPAKDVGGDFFDFFFIDDDHLCMLIADVSGKGIPAALFMMSSKLFITDHAMPGKTPGEILTEANKAICADNKEKMFVTVWVGILEISTGKLTAANGGHEKPAITSNGKPFELLEDKHGVILGISKNRQYTEYEVMLSPGDTVFLYTDGVTEAMVSPKEQFGIDRMLAVLNRNIQASPEQIVKNVIFSITEFVNGAEQSDDITMLCLRYNG